MYYYIKLIIYCMLFKKSYVKRNEFKKGNYSSYRCYNGRGHQFGAPFPAFYQSLCNDKTPEVLNGPDNLRFRVLTL